MTHVTFHYGAADKQLYASRLVRKIVQSGVPTCVLGDRVQLQALSVQIWSLGPEDFWPHADPHATPLTARYSRVRLVAEALVPQDTEVLLNLRPEVPQNMPHIARVIEVVGLDDADRGGARARWKHYAAQGFTIEKHEIPAAAG